MTELFFILVGIFIGMAIDDKIDKYETANRHRTKDRQN